MTSSNGNIFRVTVTSGFPSQRPATRSFGVFFDLPLNKSRRWWLDTSSRSLWRHFNVLTQVVSPWSLGPMIWSTRKKTMKSTSDHVNVWIASIVITKLIGPAKISLESRHDHGKSQARYGHKFALRLKFTGTMLTKIRKKPKMNIRDASGCLIESRNSPRKS